MDELGVVGPCVANDRVQGIHSPSWPEVEQRAQWLDRTGIADCPQRVCSRLLRGLFRPPGSHLEPLQEVLDVDWCRSGQSSECTR